MKKLAAIVLSLVLSASSAYAADAEIITNGFRFQEKDGILLMAGEAKNNTSVDFKDLHVVVTLKLGKKVVKSYDISAGELKAGVQDTIPVRGKAPQGRWNDYTMEFYEGTTPLFWRTPKTK